MNILVQIALYILISTKTNAETEPRCAKVGPCLDQFSKDARDISAFLNTGPGHGKAYEWMAKMSDKFGHRMVGSKTLDNAIDYVVKTNNKTGIGIFDRVWTEDVPGLPYWVRGKADTASYYDETNRRWNAMAILAVGGSSPGAITNVSAVVVESIDELNQLDAKNSVRGKAVIFTQVWKGEGFDGYVNTVSSRYIGEQIAAYGAAAVLIRSVTPSSIYSPHTGQGFAYGKSVPIPAVCITLEDADHFSRMQKDGKPINISMNVTSHRNGVTTSRNIFFELRGSVNPEQVVLISGHFDSWDVGQGAMDDMGGCAATLQALTTLKQMGFAPRKTIRVAFWTAEELASKTGAGHHFEQSVKNTNERYIFVSESDAGAFKPTRDGHAVLWFSGDISEQNYIKNKIGHALQCYTGVNVNVKSVKADFQGDVNFWAKKGIPAVNYLASDRMNYYMSFHHTNGDTVSVFKPEDLDYVSSVFAILAHGYANRP